MKDILPKLKTKITGWVMALGPAAALLGYNYDPIIVSGWIEQFSGLIVAVYLALGGAVHFFRNLADKE